MDYLKENKALWNQRTAAHIDSDFYDTASFLQGKNSLKYPELELLGDVNGKDLLHLQCHFGQDTLSLARMGARVTGIDLSDAAITEACRLRDELSLQARFVETDVYCAPEALQETFDVVFTSYGVTGWLPDLEKWAAVVAHFLRPGGIFVMAEFHPVVWMFDNAFTRFQYSYFDTGMIIEESQGTYTDRNAPIIAKECCWNHTLADHISALAHQGLELKEFREYDHSVHPCFRNVTEISPGKWQIQGLEGIIPMMFAMQWQKKS